MSDESFDGINEDELDAILETDDPEQIEAFLSGQKAEPKAEAVADEEIEEADEVTEEPENKQGVEGASPGAEGEEIENAPAEDDEKPYVISKNGKHKIPYEAHTALRDERNEYKRKFEEVNQKLAEFQNSSAKVTKVLEQNGIDLSALERGETLDADQLAELERLDPGVAKMARMTMSAFERINELAEQIQQVKQAPSVNPIELAIRENADLTTWRKSDPDRWEMAVRYDDLLQQDPAFANATLDERFAEAVARTKKLFGDVTSPARSQKPNQTREDAERIAAEKVAAANKSAVPRSLTNVGVTPAAERSKLEVIGDLDGDALIDSIGNMHPDEVEKLLAAAYS